MAVVTVTLEGLSGQIEADAERIRSFLAGKAAAATKKKISIVAVAGVKEHFLESRAPNGIAWAPLAHRQGKPLLDTGILRGATTAQVTPDGVELHNNRIQANIHQYGGIIRPTKGKYLAIPLTPQARREVSPRNMPGLHFVGRKGANRGALVNDRGQAQFALVPSVKIPARPFLGFSKKTLDKVERILIEDVTRALGAGADNGEQPA